jgi:DNA-directed RNA polymerase subunit alpha
MGCIRSPKKPVDKMSQVEAPEAPAANPAAFFSAPPSSPSELLAARAEQMTGPDQASKFESLARQARENGDAVAAAASWVCGDFRKAIKLATGDDEMSRFIRGSSALELDEAKIALESLSGSVNAKDPALAAAAMHAMAAAGPADKLAAALAKATLKDADQAYFEGRVMETEQDYAGAAAAYVRALEIDDLHVAARFRHAFRADLMGDDELAIREYETMLGLRPIPVAALINLGVLYEDRNDFERACGCFGAVLRRDPNHALARLYFTDAHDSLDMYYDENLELKEDQLMKVLRTPITDFELSVRARNCLANMDIKSLGDLVSHSEAELLEFKNFGETSLNEIKRVLGQKGLRLGMQREDGTFIIPDDFDAARSVDLEAELSWLGELTDEQREALELQISTLNLSVRCHRALVERLGLQRVGDILLYSEEDLLGMPNFGITSLNELQNKLAEFGLRLRSGRGEEMEG